MRLFSVAADSRMAHSRMHVMSSNFHFEKPTPPAPLKGGNFLG
jgi:hypothetical protein